MNKVLNYVLKIVVIVAIAVGCVFVYTNYIKKDNNGEDVKITTEVKELSFKDIGQLATQEAMVTQVQVYDKTQSAPLNLFKYGETKYIYSYDVYVKAGYDFTSIIPEVDEETKVISITLPEAEILSCEIDTDSFVVYHEQTSVFSKETLDEKNAELTELQEQAKQKAIENGILEKAKDNAETLLTAFVHQTFDENEYTIEWK